MLEGWASHQRIVALAAIGQPAANNPQAPLFRNSVGIICKALPVQCTLGPVRLSAGAAAHVDQPKEAFWRVALRRRSAPTCST